MCTVKEMTVFLKFTFHYVSIKSLSAQVQPTAESNLHSTMYLLNLLLLGLHLHIFAYLHSTMYLLNEQGKYYVIGLSKFTFHYVSIKSRMDNKYKRLTEIYIPLCIY